MHSHRLIFPLMSAVLFGIAHSLFVLYLKICNMARTTMLSMAAGSLHLHAHLASLSYHDEPRNCHYTLIEIPSLGINLPLVNTTTKAASMGQGHIHTTVRRIAYSSVRRDIQRSQPPKHYNTSSHPQSALPPGHNLGRPSETPNHFGRWLKLILETRSIPKKDVQIVNLTRWEVQLLVDAAAVSTITKTLGWPYKEIIFDMFGHAFARTTYPAIGRFIRLNACSPEDGVRAARRRPEDRAKPPNMSTFAISDVILKLVTSQSARDALLKELDLGAEKIPVFFLPFEETFSPSKQYRVFCAPGTGRITAISQYQWHKPWRYAHLRNAQRQEKAKHITRGVVAIHDMIMKELGPSAEDALLMKQGFTFDVIWDEQRKASNWWTYDMCLLELNVFGATSTCGSCLFHWVEDMDLLYGRRDAVEFRLTY